MIVVSIAQFEFCLLQTRFLHIWSFIIIYYRKTFPVCHSDQKESSRSGMIVGELRGKLNGKEIIGTHLIGNWSTLQSRATVFNVNFENVDPEHALCLQTLTDIVLPAFWHSAHEVKLFFLSMHSNKIEAVVFFGFIYRYQVTSIMTFDNPILDVQINNIFATSYYLIH